MNEDGNKEASHTLHTTTYRRRETDDLYRNTYTYLSLLGSQEKAESGSQPPHSFGKRDDDDNTTLLIVFSLFLPHCFLMTLPSPNQSMSCQ